MIWFSSNTVLRVPPSARAVLLPRLAVFRVFVLAVLLVPAAVRGHVPVPDSVLDPKTPAEAWNVLRLATANVERLLNENRLAEIPDQLSLCSPALRALPKFSSASSSASEQTRPIAEQSVRAGVAVNSLAQAGVAGDRTTAVAMFGSLRDALAALAARYDPALTKADIFFCPMHPDVVSPDHAAHCPKCGMSLLTRRIPYSFVYVPPGEPTLRLTAAAGAAVVADAGAGAHPVAGQPLNVTVKLTRRDGSPVLLPDLLVMHTQPIHLLIVDPALADYHHEHPTPTATPGEYAFSFIPARTTSYRIFADVVPADSGVQEYPFTDLPVVGSSSPMPVPAIRQNSFVSTVGGLRFVLTLEETDGSLPRAGQARSLRVSVTDAASGKPAIALEPVMSAYAHLVGFYDDYHTVVHLHPAGGEILDPSARGGPELDFKFYPPKAGFVRLYCQVQVGGRMVFAVFDLNVAP